VTHLISRLAGGTACVLAAFALAGCGGGGGGADEPSSQPTASAPSLTLSGSSASTVALAWSQADGITGYTLQRQSPGTAYAPVAELPAEQHQYLDEGLAPHTAYSYRLVAHRNGGDDQVEGSATTTDDTPEVTGIGAVLAEIGRAPMGAAGGSMASADGSVRLDVPAGAWTADTTLVLQSQENTAPGGVGAALHLSLPAAPTKPLTLSLAYDPSDAPNADGLGVALQRRDGSWLSLPIKAVDHAARRITLELPLSVLQRTSTAQAMRAHATAVDDISIELTLVKYERLFLSPKSASLPVNGTQKFVPYSRTVTRDEGEEICFDDGSGICLPPLPVVTAHQAAFLNSKAGYTRQWLVQDVVGGNSSLGTVQPQADVGALYTAPRRAPTPNPVLVVFRSRHDKSGRSIELSAPVKVTEPVWTGILHGTMGGAADLGFSFSAEAVWTLDAASDDEFHASGTQSVHVINITCTGSASPATVPLPPGLLKIDRSTTPAHYTLDVGSLWNTVITGTCPGVGTASVGMVVPGEVQAQGSVSADGTRIDGSATLNNIQWEWSLSSQLP
jgi:hypothetical protein